MLLCDHSCFPRPKLLFLPTRSWSSGATHKELLRFCCDNRYRGPGHLWSHSFGFPSALIVKGAVITSPLPQLVLFPRLLVGSSGSLRSPEDLRLRLSSAKAVELPPLVGQNFWGHSIVLSFWDTGHFSPTFLRTSYATCRWFVITETIRYYLAPLSGHMSCYYNIGK